MKNLLVYLRNKRQFFMFHICKDVLHVCIQTKDNTFNAL